MTQDTHQLITASTEVAYRGGLRKLHKTQEEELIIAAKERLNSRLQEWLTDEEAVTLLPAGKLEVELSPGYTCTKSEWDTVWGCHVELKSKRKYQGFNQEEELLLTREMELHGKLVKVSVFEKVFCWDNPKEHVVSEIIIEALDEENHSTLYLAPINGFAVGLRVCGANERKSRAFFEEELGLVASGAIEKNDNRECQKAYQEVRELFFGI